MSEPVPTPLAAVEPAAGPVRRPAWQPFTFGGVAAFATASTRRTLAVAVTGATLCGLLIAGGFCFGWLPVLDAAVEALPAMGQVSEGRLQWEGAPRQLLAQSPLFAIGVNLEDGPAFGDESDLRVELRAAEWQMCGWLGCQSGHYPEGWIIAVNRPEVSAAWGARRPFVIGGVFLAGTAWVLLNWLALAAVGAAPLWLLAFFLDRPVTLAGVWRSLIVVHVPGGLTLGLALLLYGVQKLHIVALAVVGVLHFLVAVIYALGAVGRLPSIGIAPARSGRNPFHGRPPPPPESSAA